MSFKGKQKNKNKFGNILGIFSIFWPICGQLLQSLASIEREGKGWSLWTTKYHKNYNKENCPQSLFNFGRKTKLQSKTISKNEIPVILYGIMLEQWFTNGILVLANHACHDIDSYKKANTYSERKDNNNIDSYWLSVPQVISDRDSDIIKNYCPRHSFAQDQGQKSTLTAKLKALKIVNISILVFMQSLICHQSFI